MADVVLQRPFKHGLRKRFNQWAADVIQEQIQANAVVGLNTLLKMSSIKPLIMEWCINSWEQLKEGDEYVKQGWNTCCVALYDVYDQEKRRDIVEAAARGELDHSWVPGGSVAEDKEKQREKEDEAGNQEEEDDLADMLDIMKITAVGERRSTRNRTQRSAAGYMLNSSQISLSEDSDNENFPQFRSCHRHLFNFFTHHILNYL